MSIRSTIITSTAALVTVLSLVGCGQEGSSVRPGPLAPEVSIEADESGALGAPRPPEFDPEDFVGKVDNPFFPLVPGTVMTFVKQTDQGVETVKVHVTRDTEVIMGVRATVVRDRVFLDGSLKEDTFDWYAQDEDGNVWYMGEDTKEYENGKVVSTAGTWKAGKDGARPGIIMLAHPRSGDSYDQEHAPGVAEDHAAVLSRRKTVSVPYGTFRRCLLTLETTALNPASRELKYYAAGIGQVLVTAEDGSDREELTSVTRK